MSTDYKSLLAHKPDYIVCTCFEVMHSDIVAAIERGNATFKGLSQELGVGTGCSSCVEEVQQILSRAIKNEKNKHSC